MEKVNKDKLIVKGAKALAFTTKWFLVGYGFMSVLIDVKELTKRAK